MPEETSQEVTEPGLEPGLFPRGVRAGRKPRREQACVPRPCPGVRQHLRCSSWSSRGTDLPSGWVGCHSLHRQPLLWPIRLSLPSPEPPSLRPGHPRQPLTGPGLHPGAPAVHTGPAVSRQNLRGHCLLKRPPGLPLTLRETRDPPTLPTPPNTIFLPPPAPLHPTGTPSTSPPRPHPPAPLPGPPMPRPVHTGSAHSSGAGQIEATSSERGADHCI